MQDGLRRSRESRAEAVLPLQETDTLTRNLMIGGRRTSVRLEAEMWAALFDIAARESQSIGRICSLVDEKRRPETSLTAAIRVFVLAYYRAAATEAGHRRAGHGDGAGH
jgi:predicted DNA-binding ribbon-helix-helix protein